MLVSINNKQFIVFTPEQAELVADAIEGAILRPEVSHEDESRIQTFVDWLREKANDKPEPSQVTVNSVSNSMDPRSMESIQILGADEVKIDKSPDEKTVAVAVRHAGNCVNLYKITDYCTSERLRIMQEKL